MPSARRSFTPMAPSHSEAHGRTDSRTFRRKCLIGGTPTIEQSAPVPSAGVGAPTCWASRLAMGRPLAGGGNTRGRTGPRRGAPRRTDPRARGHHTPPRAASHGRARPSTEVENLVRQHMDNGRAPSRLMRGGGRESSTMQGDGLAAKPPPSAGKPRRPCSARPRFREEGGRRHQPKVGAGALLRFTRPTGRAHT